ncbi:MAG: uroporphyrinogen-III synthase [Burkholderiales bacterium]|nr:uroporphyrinogen-III synthase [Burkholderiales bacterium]
MQVVARQEPATSLLMGRRVVVTRPAGQAHELTAALVEAGAVVIALPGVEIGALPASAALDAALAELGTFDLVIFVSANAVHAAQARCAALGIGDLRVLRRAAAPGPGTAAALKAAGVTEVLAPHARFDSEGLLAAIDALEVTPPRVLILRGRDACGNADSGDGAGQPGRNAVAGNGREVLGIELARRGSNVRTLACYRRTTPPHDAERIAGLIGGGPAHALLVSSSQVVDNLPGVLGAAGMAWLDGVPVFATHARVAAAARRRGFAPVFECAAGEEAIVRTLAAHLSGSTP